MKLLNLVSKTSDSVVDDKKPLKNVYDGPAPKPKKKVPSVKIGKYGVVGLGISSEDLGGNSDADGGGDGGGGE